MHTAERDLKIYQLVKSGKRISVVAREIGVSRAVVMKASERAQRKAFSAEKSILDVLMMHFDDHDWRLVSRDRVSVRVSNCARNEGCATLLEFISIPDAELLRCPNFSKTSLAEVVALRRELVNFYNEGVEHG